MRKIAFAPKSPALYILLAESKKRGGEGFMWSHRCGGEHSWVKYTVVFGIGLALSCFCPSGFIMFVLAVLLIALGIALLKRC